MRSKKAINALHSTDPAVRQAVIFVHGYNVSFNEAALSALPSDNNRVQHLEKRFLSATATGPRDPRESDNRTLHSLADAISPKNYRVPRRCDGGTPGGFVARVVTFRRQTKSCMISSSAPSTSIFRRSISDPMKVDNRRV